MIINELVIPGTPRR